MNILIYTTLGISCYSGGIERFAFVIGKKMMEDGYNVYFVSANHPPFETDKCDIQQYYIPDKNNLCNIENITFIKNKIIENNIDIVFNQQADGYKQVMLCDEARKGTKAKLVSILHFEPLYYIKTFTASINDLITSGLTLNTILYYIIHNTFLYKRYKKKRIGRMYSRIYNMSDAIVLLSDSYKEDFYKLIKRKDIVNNKLYVISNPITSNITDIDYSYKKNEILYVGRLNFNDKRPDLLLKIWNSINKEFEDWRLIILGEGNYSKILQKKISNNNIRNIDVFGFKNSDLFYKTAKILCVTSNTEGFSLVTIEASNNYVVPIAFNSFGAASDVIINNKTGYLIEPFNKKKYINVLRNLMYNAEKLKKMASEAHSHAQNFDIDIIIKKWYSLFNNIINDKI